MHGASQHQSWETPRVPDHQPPRFPRTIRRPKRVDVMEVRQIVRKRPIVGLNSLPVILVSGFALMILAGTIILMLPISSRDGEWTSPVIALFVATSAVCVTGLVPVDTATHWSGFGHAVILLLIQLGGLGFMTGTTILFLLFGWRVGIRERILLSGALDLNRTGGVIRFTRRAVAFTFLFEAVGFVVLSLRFAFDEPIPRALVLGLFHSVSAFNNAGFDLLGDFKSLEETRDAVTLTTMGILVIAGGFGYLVMEDLLQVRQNRLSLDTKLVIRTTGGLLLFGFVFVALFEWNNTLAGLTLPDKVLQSAFFAVSSRTAGLATVPIGELNHETQFSTMALMFIGGASGSTAGGIKVGTFAIVVAMVFSAVRSRPHVEAAGREIRRTEVDKALAVTFLSFLLLFGITVLLTAIEDFSFLAIMFEATSAFGTAGLSTGITPQLGDASLVILSLTMFLGRLGPLTLVLAILQANPAQNRRLPDERVRIG